MLCLSKYYSILHRTVIVLSCVMWLCVLYPEQQCSWLGFDINLAQRKIAIPQAKLSGLCIQLQQAVQQGKLLTKYLASIVGRIISMSIAIRPVSRLMTRSLYGLLNTRQAWCEMLTVSPEVRDNITACHLTFDRLTGLFDSLKSI